MLLRLLLALLINLPVLDCWADSSNDKELRLKDEYLGELEKVLPELLFKFVKQRKFQIRLAKKLEFFFPKGEHLGNVDYDINFTLLDKNPEQPATRTAHGVIKTNNELGIILSLDAPLVVAGFAIEAKGQQLYIHSPISKLERKLPVVLRGDLLLNSLLAYDDLNVFSGKDEAFSSKVIGEKVILGLFPALEVYTKVAAEQLEIQQSFAGWLPEQAYFVPRRVVVLEQFPKNLFYYSGRQILIVDQESSLPLYKLVYNKRGVVEKIVIGGWGVVQQTNEPAGTKSNELGSKIPFLAFLLIIDKTGNKATVISVNHLRVR